MYKEICRGISKKTGQVIEGHWADSNGIQAFVCKKINSLWEEVELFSLEFFIDEKWVKVYKEEAAPENASSFREIIDLLRRIKECVDVEGGFDSNNFGLYKRLEEVLDQQK